MWCMGQEGRWSGTKMEEVVEEVRELKKNGSSWLKAGGGGGTTSPNNTTACKTREDAPTSSGNNPLDATIVPVQAAGG